MTVVIKLLTFILWYNLVINMVDFVVNKFNFIKMILNIFLVFKNLFT